MSKLLIVVDYQNDFVSGSLGFEKAHLIENKICEKIDFYHKNNDVVAFTLDTHFENYLNTFEGKNLPVPHCIKGTQGHLLSEKVRNAKNQNDQSFEKNCFGSDKLYEYLKNNTFDSIELVGVVTNICVISNAILAKTALPETEVMVDALCVASNDNKLNTEALNVMESLQIKIINR